VTTCICWHAIEEHGGDPKYPGATDCHADDCDCIAYRPMRTWKPISKSTTMTEQRRVPNCPDKLPSWRKVADDPPKVGKYVLCYFVGGFVCSCAYAQGTYDDQPRWYSDFIARQGQLPTHWMPLPEPPKWDRDSWKPKDRRRNLVRAAALLIAEIERLDRRETSGD
jgi:hypothetical protein